MERGRVYFYEWADGTYSKEGDIKDSKMQCHAKSNGSNQIWVSPQRQSQQTLVFGKWVHCVEHLNDYKNRQRHRRCAMCHLVREHLTADLREGRWALMEVCLGLKNWLSKRREDETGGSGNWGVHTYQLIEGDLWTLGVKYEPPSINEDSRTPDVYSNDQVPEEKPFANKWLTAISRWKTHDRMVRWVKTEGGGGKTIRYEVNPK